MSIPYERSPDADPNTENDPSDRPLIGGGSRRGPGYSEPDQGEGDSWRRQPNREDE